MLSMVEQLSCSVKASIQISDRSLSGGAEERVSDDFKMACASYVLRSLAIFFFHPHLVQTMNFLGSLKGYAQPNFQIKQVSVTIWILCMQNCCLSQLNIALLLLRLLAEQGLELVEFIF